MRIFYIITVCILSGIVCLADTDHGGSDWTLSNGETIDGVHNNVASFTVPAGVTVYVRTWNGSTYGQVEVNAQNVYVYGTIIADGRGYRGGNGGSGGNGAAGAGGNTGNSDP